MKGRSREVLCVFALFFALAYVMAPASHQATRVIIPQGGDLDAEQQTLLVTTGADTLLSHPSRYYDTAILYPDHNQFRSTEPFLGFSLVAVPLRAMHLSDVTIFEVLRWLLTVSALGYAYLFFRAIGVGVALSVVGAVLCVFQHNILGRIESLQILSIPLIFALLYHACMLWTSQGSRLGHRIGLFVWVALYPLLGAINALFVVIAALFALPMALKMLGALRRDEWLVWVVPIGAAVVCDAVALAPWLLDRADLAAYVSPEFLRIKHWKPTELPANLDQLRDFLGGRLGYGLIAALLLSLGVRRARGSVRDDERIRQGSPALYMLALPAMAVALVVIFLSYLDRPIVGWMTVAFQVTCYGALWAYWRDQLRAPVVRTPGEMAGFVLLISGGLAVFMGLLSFGPLFVSNDSLLATDLARRLLFLVSPLKSLREYARMWEFGAMALSVWAVLRLDVNLRTRSAFARAAAVGLISIGLLFTVYTRPTLVASEEIVGSADVLQLASHSRGRAGVYVHPLMQWNTSSSVRMVAMARDMDRPVVNGCLGIVLPWFPYATSVLERFPDEESLWLLRKWRIDTVIDLDPSQHAQPPADVQKAFMNPYGVTWDIDERADAAHPSDPAASQSAKFERIDVKLPESGDGRPLTFNVPQGLSVLAVEVHFALSTLAIDQMPTAIDVWSTSDTGERIRVNAGNSGQWLESLAADALLHRKAPIATVRLNGPQAHDLRLERRGDGKAPIASVVLLGMRLR